VVGGQDPYDQIGKLAQKEGQDDSQYHQCHFWIQFRIGIGLLGSFRVRTRFTIAVFRTVVILIGDIFGVDF
jgi:hypothetical protein